MKLLCNSFVLQIYGVPGTGDAVNVEQNLRPLTELDGEAFKQFHEEIRNDNCGDWRAHEELLKEDLDLR